VFPHEMSKMRPSLSLRQSLCRATALCSVSSPDAAPAAAALPSPSDNTANAAANAATPVLAVGAGDAIAEVRVAANALLADAGPAADVAGEGVVAERDARSVALWDALERVALRPAEGEQGTDDGTGEATAIQHAFRDTFRAASMVLEAGDATLAVGSLGAYESSPFTVASGSFRVSTVGREPRGASALRASVPAAVAARAREVARVLDAATTARAALEALARLFSRDVAYRRVRNFLTRVWSFLPRGAIDDAVDTLAEVAHVAAHSASDDEQGFFSSQQTVRLDSF
jgi:hypothetical protein